MPKKSTKRKDLPRVPVHVIVALKQKSAETLKNLSHAYIKSLRNYTKENPSHYKKVNAELRNLARLKSMTADQNVRICAYTSLLQSLFFNPHCPVTQVETVLYRGIGSDYVEDMLRRLKIGDVFEEAGFMSTSVVPKIAERFRDSDGSRKCCIMVLTLPPGIPVLHLESITDVKGEDEILLPPGMGLRLDDVFEYKGKTVYSFTCAYCTFDSRYHSNPMLRHKLNQKVPICF